MYLCRAIDCAILIVRCHILIVRAVPYFDRIGGAQSQFDMRSTITIGYEEHNHNRIGGAQSQ
jgi:hypothetical protein